MAKVGSASTAERSLRLSGDETAQDITSATLAVSTTK